MIEALNATKECAKRFWRFVFKILHKEERNFASFTFTAGDAVLLLVHLLVHLHQLLQIKLRRNSEEWEEANSHVSTAVVPVVIQASILEEKNRVLCEGIYQYFVQSFGTKSTSQNPRKDKEDMPGI